MTSLAQTDDSVHSADEVGFTVSEKLMLLQVILISFNVPGQLFCFCRRQMSLRARLPPCLSRLPSISCRMLLRDTGGTRSFRPFEERETLSRLSQAREDAGAPPGHYPLYGPM